MGRYSIKRAAVLLLIITIVEKILGFGREMVIASQFGATWRTDSYIAGYLIPNFIMVLLNAGLVNVYAPVFLSEKEFDRESAWDKINSVSTYLMIILFFITMLGILLSPVIVKLIYSGFDSESMKATISISRIFFTGVFIYCAVIIESSILNCYKHFVYPVVSIAMLSVGMIVWVMLFGGKTNINSIAYGYLGGAVAGLLIQYMKLKRLDGRLKPNFRIYPSFNLKFLELLIPVLIATSMSQANVFVDRIFASYLPEGSISYLTYSDKVTQLPIVIFSGIIATVIFPDMINYINKNDMEKLKYYFNRAITVTLIFLIPSFAGLAILSKEIIRLLFERNVFDSMASVKTASALVFYSPTIVLYGGMAVISKVYYSMKDTKTLMYISISTIAMNAILDYLLMGPMAHNGLALATSIVAVVQFCAAYFLLKRKTGISMGVQQLKNILKIIVSSAVMGIAISIIKNYLASSSVVIITIISVFVGASVYFIMLFVLRIDELNPMLNRFRRRKGEAKN